MIKSRMSPAFALIAAAAIVSLLGYSNPILADSASPKSEAASQGSASAGVVAASPCKSQVWFDLTPHEITSACGAQYPTLPLSPADVNGDAIAESISASAGLINFRILDSGEEPCSQRKPLQGVAFENALTAISLSRSGGNSTVVTTNILDLPASFGDSLIQFLPNPGYPSNPYQMWRGEIQDVGWFDCDGDGDLDIVLTIRFRENHANYTECGSWYGWTTFRVSGFWLENIGHQRTPNAADLDGNGAVDGGDLALLLLNWSS